MNKLILIILLALMFVGCDLPPQNSDDKQMAEQERILMEGTNAIGMPAIKNFREKRLLKDIIEMRDNESLVTYTYLFSEQTGKLIFLCNSIGFGIPYATQFTNPLKTVDTYHGATTIAQADPNGLFSPAAAEGTWVMCSDNVKGKATPMYVEPRVVTSTYKLDL